MLVGWGHLARATGLANVVVSWNFPAASVSAGRRNGVPPNGLRLASSAPQHYDVDHADEPAFFLLLSINAAHGAVDARRHGPSLGTCRPPVTNDEYESQIV